MDTHGGKVYRNLNHRASPHIKPEESLLSVFTKKSVNYGAGPVVQWISLCAPLWQPGVHGFGSQAWTYTLLIKSCCGGIPHSTQRKMGTDVSSGAIFLTKKNMNCSSQPLWRQQLDSHSRDCPVLRRHESLLQFFRLWRLFLSLSEYLLA